MSASSAGSCPICGRPTVAAVKPFCSKRCADVDLSRWLSGVYRIEGPETADPAERNGHDGQGDEE